MLGPVQVGHDPAHLGQGVCIVLGQMIGHAADARVHVRPAQIFGRDDFPRRRLHQRRPGQKNGTLLLDDDRLVRHRGHIGAARGAGAHHRGDLRDARRRHGRLVVEYPPEMLAVGEHVILLGQVRAAGIHQIDAGQVVLPGDFLGTQMLLHRDRKIRPPLDRRIVRHDHAFPARDPADAGQDPAGGNHVLIHLPPGELGELHEGCAFIEQRVDTIAGQQLASAQMARAGFLAAALLDLPDLLAQIADDRVHRGRVFREQFGSRIEARFQDGHDERLRAVDFDPANGRRPVVNTRR